MNKNEGHIFCEVCGTLTETREIDKKIYHRGKDHKLKNVVSEVCPNCGDSYTSGKVLEAIIKQIDGQQAE